MAANISAVFMARLKTCVDLSKPSENELRKINDDVFIGNARRHLIESCFRSLQTLLDEKNVVMVNESL